jgi:hypothetical protein
MWLKKIKIKRRKDREREIEGMAVVSWSVVDLENIYIFFFKNGKKWRESRCMLVVFNVLSSFLFLFFSKKK